MLQHNFSKLIVVEYSCLQRCFHVETVDRMLNSNLEATARNVVPGYVPLFVTHSQDEADTFIEKLRPLFDDRPLPVNPLQQSAPINSDATNATQAPVKPDNNIFIIGYSASKKDVWCASLQSILEQNQEKLSNATIEDYTPIWATADETEAIRFMTSFAQTYAISLRSNCIEVTELSGKTYDDLMKDING